MNAFAVLVILAILYALVEDIGRVVLWHKYMTKHNLPYSWWEAFEYILGRYHPDWGRPRPPALVHSDDAWVGSMKVAIQKYQELRLPNSTQRV
jgi:hypothetical protein